MSSQLLRLLFKSRFNLFEVTESFWNSTTYLTTPRTMFRTSSCGEAFLYNLITSFCHICIFVTQMAAKWRIFSKWLFEFKYIVGSCMNPFQFILWHPSIPYDAVFAPAYQFIVQFMMHQAPSADRLLIWWKCLNFAQKRAMIALMHLKTYQCTM